MTPPRVTGEYDYEEGELGITTDSGQNFEIRGDSADYFADELNLSEGEGDFDVSEGDWDGMFR